MGKGIQTDERDLNEISWETDACKEDDTLLAIVINCLLSIHKYYIDSTSVG